MDTCLETIPIEATARLQASFESTGVFLALAFAFHQLIVAFFFFFCRISFRWLTRFR